MLRLDLTISCGILIVVATRYREKTDISFNNTTKAPASGERKPASMGVFICRLKHETNEYLRI